MRGIGQQDGGKPADNRQCNEIGSEKQAEDVAGA